MPAKRKREKRQRLAPKCSFSRALVAFREAGSAPHKPVRAAYLAGAEAEQADSADSRNQRLEGGLPLYRRDCLARHLCVCVCVCVCVCD